MFQSTNNYATQAMVEEGIRAGNDLVREILAMQRRNEEGVLVPAITKYEMAKLLKVERQSIYNWLKGVSSPTARNYHNLCDLRLYVDRLSKIQPFILRRAS